MKKRIISILLAVVMIVGMIPLGAITAFADTVGETHTLTFADALNKTVEVAHGECLPIGDFPNPDHSLKNYLSLGWQYEKGGKMYFFNETVPVTEDLTLTYCQMSVEEVSNYSDKTEITTSDKTSLTSLSGIYTVSVGSDIVIDNRCAVHGFAVIILPDGCNIKFSKGIGVPEYRKLFILAPDGAKGTGRLTATGEDNAAGIGGDKNATGGTVDIYGGTVKATGGFKAAGIGGGDEGNGGTVHIYGGTVTATGGVNGAGIGGGFFRNGGTVNISGGTVTATGGEFSAGIGGGNGGYGGTVYISGGAVNATGGYRATGIGGGDGGNGGTVYISGGVTRAEGTTASFKSDVTLRSNMTAYDITNGEENAPMTTAYTSLKKILVIPAPYDYLAVERNAYIDTGVKPTNNTRVVMDVDVKGGREYWFGVWDIDFDKSAFALGNDMTGIYTGYGDEGGTYGQAVSNGYHTVELDKNSVKVDGNLINTHKTAEFQLNNTLYLFAQNRAGEAMVYADQSAVIHCYGCEIYEGNTLVRKFVPGKNSSDASGLWDLVNGVFYENKYEDKDHYAEMTAKYTGDVETVSEQSPTCLKNGRSAYYKKSGKYYTDAQCTDEITDLSVWLSTSDEDGGGILPALGHDWDGSLEKHTCSRCKLEEPHIDANNDKVCDACDNELLTSRDVVYLNRTVNETTGAVTTEEVRFTGDAYTVLKSDKVWGESEKTTWYILDNDVTLNNRVEVRGDVRLILRDGKTLTANYGITVEEGNALSIYAQTDDENEMGVLSITAPNGETAIGGRNGAKGEDEYDEHGGHSFGLWGGAGGATGNIRFFGGKSVLSSTDAVTVGGGNGGNGGDGGDAGDGGNGGGGGYVYFYGGCQSLRAENASAIGGGKGGARGKGSYYLGKNGSNGGNATVTVSGSLLMKAGNDAKSAKAVDGYNGQAYLQVSPPTEYYEYNASSKVFERKSTQTIPTPIESIDDYIFLESGWYIVSGEVTVKSVTFKGDAHIIIANDAVFTVENGISAINGVSLTFYAQTDDYDRMGTVKIIETVSDNAGIGSKNQGICGDITINGGTFYVQGGLNAAGIGGGADSTCGIITVNGGKVFSIGGGFGVGIGSGSKKEGRYEPTCAGVVINGGAILAVGNDGAESIGAGYGVDTVTVTYADGVYVKEGFPFACINIELFPEKQASCADGHKDYFKNCVNGKYYTTETLEPESLIEDIDEWLAGEGFTGEGDGLHIDKDNDGYCDRCGTLARANINFYISHGDTPAFTLPCIADEKLMEQVDSLAVQSVNERYGTTAGLVNYMYSDGKLVNEYDLVPFGTESIDIYAVLAYDETQPTRTKNGHKEYYENTLEGYFYEDSLCTIYIGDADALEEWLSTPVEEGGGMIPATGEQPLDTPTADDFNFIQPASCVYDGQQKQASVTTDKDGMGKITVKYQKQNAGGWDSATAEAPTEIGKYRVVISVSEGDNFAASAEDISSESWVFEITCQHKYIDYVCEYCGDELLEDAKADAIKAIHNAAEHSDDDVVKLLAEKAENTVQGAGTVEEVINARDYWLTAIIKQLGTSTHTHTFADTYSHNDTHHWRVCTCEDDACKGNITGFAVHTFTVVTNDDGSKTYTCACGYTKTVYEGGSTESEPVQGIVKCDGISLTLSSDIYINFYMQLNDSALADGRMSFTIGNRRVENVTVQVNSENGRYYFACPLNALEMAETVTATFSYGSSTYTQTYSVKRYVEIILNATDEFGEPVYPEEMQTLARKIANYGYHTQYYLESIHKNVTIGENGYAPMLHYTLDDINVTEALKLEDNFTVTEDTANLTFDGRTVYFNSATALNYYIITADGKAPKASCEGKTVEVKLYKDNTYIVSVKDIAATELDEQYTVTVGEGDDSITITGSVLDYCAAVMSAHREKTDEKDILAVNAMAAFYEYHKAAVKYVNRKTYTKGYLYFTCDAPDVKKIRMSLYGVDGEKELTYAGDGIYSDEGYFFENIGYANGSVAFTVIADASQIVLPYSAISFDKSDCAPMLIKFTGLMDDNYAREIEKLK